MIDDALHFLADTWSPPPGGRLGQNLPYEWIEDPVVCTLAVSVRHRRLPAELVVWLVILDQGQGKVEFGAKYVNRNFLPGRTPPRPTSLPAHPRPCGGATPNRLSLRPTISTGIVRESGGN